MLVEVWLEAELVPGVSDPVFYVPYPIHEIDKKSVMIHIRDGMPVLRVLYDDGVVIGDESY